MGIRIPPKRPSRLPYDFVHDMTYTVTAAVKEQRSAAAIKHGAQSGAALVPLARNVKQSVLKRMGMRQAELSWAGRETLDLYARNKAKLIALDRYFETTPFIAADGTPTGRSRCTGSPTTPP